MDNDLTAFEVNTRVAVAQAAASVAVAALAGASRAGTQEYAASVAGAVYDALIARVFAPPGKGG